MLANRRALCAAVTVAAVVATTGSAFANGAAHKHRRTQVLTYDYAPSTAEHSGLPMGGSFQGCTAAGGCFNFTTPSWARYMSVQATDQTNRKVPVSLWPDTGGSGLSTETFICGSVKNATATRNSKWNLSVDVVSVDPGCPGIATAGTVKVTFSNMK